MRRALLVLAALLTAGSILVSVAILRDCDPSAQGASVSVSVRFRDLLSSSGDQAAATATLTVLDPTRTGATATRGSAYTDTSTTNIASGTTYAVTPGTITASTAATYGNTWSGGTCSGTGTTCTLTAGQSATVTFWPTGSTTWWVATGGADGNTGHTPTTAFATFHKALTTMAGGDTLYIDDGTYSQDGGIGGYNGTYSSWDTSGCSGALAGHPPCLSSYSGSPVEGKSGADSAHRTRILGFRRHAVVVDGTGRASGKKIALQIWKAAHLEVGNIVFQHAQSVGPCEIEQSTDIYLHHVGCAYPDPVNSGDNNRAAFYIGDDDQVLVEDSWAWGWGARYGIVAHGSTNVTLRRNVIRYDGAYDGQQRAGLNLYSVYGAIAENNVVVDFQADTTGDGTSYPNDHMPFYWTCSVPLSSPSVAAGQGSTTWLGNVAVNVKGPTVSNWFLDSHCSIGGTFTAKHNVVAVGSPAASPSFAVWFSHDDTTPMTSTIFEHNTIYGGSGSTGVRIDATPPWPTMSVKDNLVTAMTGACLQNLGGGTRTLDYNHVNGCTGGFTGDSHVVTTSPSLSYLLRIDSGGGKGTASDGGDRGATVVKRYVDGSLTATDLWPFPNEDVIKTDFCGGTDGSGGVETKGHNTTGWCAGSKTLTKYVWEQLGNASPY